MLLIEQDLRGEFSNDRFCQQFVLGPAFVEALSGWQRIEVCDSLKLTVHPEVGVDQVTAGPKSITILGYILDPQNPDAENADIGLTLLGEFSTVDCLIAATARYGGRWVIIAKDDERSLLLNDAMGLRQVFYTSPDCLDEVWAGSQPGILAWHLSLKVSDEAESFISSHEFRSHPEYRWPGTATPFRQIKHLLPNHYLDLGTGKYRRFWPDKPLKPLSFDEGVEKVSGLLTGLMNAAYRRFDLVLGMTAGFDSRIVLAASRAIRKEISGVTVRQGGMPDDHQDLAVAARLLARVRIPHTIVKALPWMSGRFSKLFKENVFPAHDHYGPDVEAILKHYSRNKVVVTGSGAEVAREPFRKRIDAAKDIFTATDLAALQWMGDNKFALINCKHWLEEIDHLYNVHLLDLFSWEQSHGNWLAGTQMEFDLAWQDIFTPFNCREVLICLLSVDERYRSSPDHKLFWALVEKMWPELLGEPINPDDRLDVGRLRTLGRKLRKILKNIR